MTPRDRMLDLLPPPYTIDPASVLAGLLDVAALELEIVAEDLDRVRRTHWVDLVYQLGDLDRLAALLGIERLSWEDLPTFRARLVALARAELAGAVGPRAIRGFVFDYLSRASDALHATVVLGLNRYDAESAFEPDPDVPAYRALVLAEYPSRLRRSNVLRTRRGRVPYLFRWEERNRGLDETVTTCTLIGMPGGRTAVPIVVNLSTGDLVGWAGVVGVGQRLRVEPTGSGDQRAARATLTTLSGERDVTDRLFTLGGYRPGVPFSSGDLDPAPLLARLARGQNSFVYLSAGLYDVKGLDHVFFGIAGDDLREAVFDQTRFDHSVFTSGTVAGLELAWTEREPASFEVRVPRRVAIAPEGAGPVHQELAVALTSGVERLHAAGVRAQLRFEPFTETQRQADRVQLPWVVLPPETGPVGVVDDVGLGARFGDATFATTRFE
jgi:hypothetical protein